MSTVYLIRHAESQANAGYRTTDPARIPLTPRGHRQAQDIAERFITTPSVIITSRYERTQQTAAPTCMRFPQVDREEWPVHEFTYISPDHCVDMTAEERKPLIAAFWARNNPFYVDGAGAESWAEFLLRAHATRRRLEAETREQIALFTHGQFIKMFLALVLGPTPSLDDQSMCAWRTWMQEAPIGNAQMLRLTYTLQCGWKLNAPENAVSPEPFASSSSMMWAESQR